MHSWGIAIAMTVLLASGTDAVDAADGRTLTKKEQQKIKKENAQERMNNVSADRWLKRCKKYWKHKELQNSGMESKNPWGRAYQKGSSEEWWNVMRRLCDAAAESKATISEEISEEGRPYPLLPTD